MLITVCLSFPNHFNNSIQFNSIINDYYIKKVYKLPVVLTKKDQNKLIFFVFIKRLGLFSKSMLGSRILQP